MSDGQEKSPFSESLAAEENGLGFENLNQRLQRYAGAKSRALDMADYKNIIDYHRKINLEDPSDNDAPETIYEEHSLLFSLPRLSSLSTPENMQKVLEKLEVHIYDRPSRFDSYLKSFFKK